MKLLRLKSLQNVTLETIASFCRESLVEFELDVKKCIAFGECLCIDTNKVYSKFKESLNESMEGVGCPAHILHNVGHTEANVLSVDVEVIVVRLFSFFSIYTVQSEKTKDFCVFVGVQYASIFSRSNTR